MSIRLRLTLLYSAILALTLIVFGTTIYFIQSHVTLDAIQAGLERNAQAFNAPDRRSPPRPDGGLPFEPFRGRWTQLREPDGTVTARTPDLGELTLPLSDTGLRAVQAGRPWTETAQVDGESLLIHSRPIVNQNRVARIVQVAISLTEREQSLAMLRLILVSGSAIVIIVAFVIGWFLAGITLEPIHRITRTAQAIGAERDFSRRVQHAGPNDEIGQLATMFNSMLTELESAYRQVERALQTQRRFVADASHELRTPLTTVRGNIDLLRQDSPMDAKERGDVLADTKDEVERLIRLVNQLLMLARVDARRPMRQESFPVNMLLDDVCRQAQTLAPNRTVTCDAAIDAHVLGDRDALKQVLLILLDNAITHTPAAASVSITTTLDQNVSVSVRDTGPGIPPDLLPHIFERFYRGDVSRSMGGAGLGLSIAKELTEAQGGTLTVSSQVGQGSIFTVTMPRASK